MERKLRLIEIIKSAIDFGFDKVAREATKELALMMGITLVATKTYRVDNEILREGIANKNLITFAREYRRLCSPCSLIDAKMEYNRRLDDAE